jgi:hypothetical protein
LDAILQKWRADGSIIIGLQVRTAFIEKELDQYWSCVTKVADGADFKVSSHRVMYINY